MTTKKKQGALRAQRMLRDLLNLILKIDCPTCGATSDVTGIDDDVSLWPHRIGGVDGGKPCPDGERKAPILPLLAARQRPQKKSRKPSEQKP